jgi:hypothetical protein
MPALWYATPVGGIVGQHIPLDHRDGLVVIGEHPRGKQPAHARAQNDGTFTQYRRGEPRVADHTPQWSFAHSVKKALRNESKHHSNE